MNLSRDALKTLIGVIIIKFTTGVISSWGSINLYILSYFHYQGVMINSHTNSIMILSVVIPISFLILLATKLSDKFGYETVIRVCAILFFLSPLVMYYKFTFYTLVIFCFFLPSSAFAISSIPVLNVLWTQFPKAKNMVTAIATISFGLGGVFWNYMFTLYVNPENEMTEAIDPVSNMPFFSKSVSQNVVPCMKIGFVLCGLLINVGAFLVKKNFQYEDSTISGDIQLRNITLSNSFIPEYEKDESDRNNQQKEQKERNEEQKVRGGKKLRQALTDSRFISIFLISFITGVYQIFLNMNIKIIYMPIVQDDLFLVYCVISSTVASIVGAVVWGYIGDKKNFYYTLLIFSVSDLIVKMYGLFATTKLRIFLLFVFIGLIDKGMLTIMGPGLVKIFGIDTATQLLPYKGLSIFIGFLFAPLGYLLLNSFMNPFQYLFFMSFYSIFSVFLALKLYRERGSRKV